MRMKANRYFTTISTDTLDACAKRCTTPLMLIGLMQNPTPLHTALLAHCAYAAQSSAACVCGVPRASYGLARLGRDRIHSHTRHAASKSVLRPKGKYAGNTSNYATRLCTRYKAATAARHDCNKQDIDARDTALYARPAQAHTRRCCSLHIYAPWSVPAAL